MSYLKIFPNPGIGAFTVESNEDMYGGELRVYNEEGKVVITLPKLNGNHVTLNMSMLPKGFYLVRIFTHEETFVGSIVLE